MTTPILSIKNLNVTYDHDIFSKAKKAVKDLSCQFNAGECVGYLGHNGAGKTTTIRCILGLMKPQSGEILFSGKRISAQSRYQIGYMPEVNKLPKNLTPSEILDQHLTLYRQRQNAKQRIAETLEQLSLAPHKKKFVRQLSKGMGRRLAWGLASIHLPKFIILDEPFSGLDPQGCLELEDWILDLKAQGTGFLFCTHNLEIALRVSDNVHVVKGGQLAFSTMGDDQFQDRTTVSYSGVSLREMQECQQRYHLPEWDGHSAKNLLTQLYFTDYDAAMKWIQIGKEKGWILMSFDMRNQHRREQLLRHYRQTSVLTKGDAL